MASEYNSLVDELVEQSGLSQDFPVLTSASIKEQAIVLLFIAGVNRDTIAEFCDVARSTVFEIAKRYGADKYSDKAAFIQRTIVSTTLSSIVLEMTLRAKSKIGSMKEASAAELLNIARQCADIFARIKQPSKRDQQREQSLLEELRGKR